MKLNYFPVLNVHLITDAHGITQDLFFKEKQFVFGLDECLKMKFERHDI